MKKISVVISAFNEENNIKDCLESVRHLADEIIVIDNQSTDKTVAIAKQYTKKIFSRSNNPMLNINKNFGFTKANGDWILNLDADERVTPELRKEISSHLRGVHSATSEERLPVGYEIPRKNIIFNKWIQHGLWWPDYQLRLFQRGKGKFPCVHVHEKIKVQGKTAKLKHSLLHYNYQTVSQFIQKLDRIYTENEAENFLKSGKKIVWQDAIRMPVNDFLSVFLARKGYKDGLHGLVLALFQSFYALAVFAKVWEKQGFKEIKEKSFLDLTEKEFVRAGQKRNYWFLTTKIQQSGGVFSKLWYQMKRKFNQ